MATSCARWFRSSTTKSIELLSTYAVAAADGLFIANEVGGDGVDLFGLFELHAQLVVDAAVRLTNPKESTDDAVK